MSESATPFWGAKDREDRPVSFWPYGINGRSTSARIRMRRARSARGIPEKSMEKILDSDSAHMGAGIGSPSTSVNCAPNAWSIPMPPSIVAEPPRPIMIFCLPFESISLMNSPSG